jgi:hypothetical protein
MWGDKRVNYWFCTACGACPFCDGTQHPGHYRVNLGCVDGLELLALEVEYIDGRSF